MSAVDFSSDCSDSKADPDIVHEAGLIDCARPCASTSASPGAIGHSIWNLTTDPLSVRVETTISSTTALVFSDSGTTTHVFEDRLRTGRVGALLFKLKSRPLPARAELALQTPPAAASHAEIVVVTHKKAGWSFDRQAVRLRFDIDVT